MRRTKLLVWILCLGLLTCCGNEKEPAQEALDFRTALMEAGSCSFTAEVTAAYEDRFYQFTMACVCDQQSAKLEVLAPENIAGITATVSGEGAVLSFDGASLEFGKMANGYVSPVACPWLLAQCWTGAYISCSGADGEQERVTYLRGYNDEELTVDTWFLNNVPTRAEVVWNGVRCITVLIKDFQI